MSAQVFMVLALVAVQSEDHVTAEPALVEEAFRAQMNTSWQKSELSVHFVQVSTEMTQEVKAMMDAAKEKWGQTSSKYVDCAFCQGDFPEYKMDTDIRDLFTCKECVRKLQRAYNVVKRIIEDAGGVETESRKRIMANVLVELWVERKPDLSIEQFLKAHFLTYEAKGIYTNLNILVNKAQSEGRYVVV